MIAISSLGVTQIQFFNYINTEALLTVVIHLFWFSGIGLSLADEIAHELHQCYDVHFCVTCRSISKGEALKKSLQKYPIKVTLVRMNVESIKSVVNACKEIKEKYVQYEYYMFNSVLAFISQ